MNLSHTPFLGERFRLNVLLTQADYLTIKSLLNSEEFEIGYPNSEVRLSMVRLYADELLRGVNRLAAGVSVLASKLDTEDLATVVTYFKDALSKSKDNALIA